MNDMKDSIGNLLPEGVWLSHGSSPEEGMRAMTVNSFLLAAKASLQNGKTVIYDKDTMTATITDDYGMTSFISHC